jgi:hypothetical protein
VNNEAALGFSKLLLAGPYIDTVEMLLPMISHSPVVFWLLPAFGLRGTGYFLATTETIFGVLIFLGYCRSRSTPARPGCQASGSN